jgi:hypothetical protein
VAPISLIAMNNPPSRARRGLLQQGQLQADPAIVSSRIRVGNGRTNRFFAVRTVASIRTRRYRVNAK